MSTRTLPTQRAAAFAVLLTGTFMFVLDFFIVNVALPSMQARLHAGAGSIQWVVAGYAIAVAAFLVTGGRLGDALGRRRTFSAGLALFTVASAVCGAAPNASVLVGGRVAQGLGAALLSPSVLSMIGVLYVGDDRARALGVYGLVMGLAAVSGQLIGGVLIHFDLAGLGWRNCFLINVPIGIVALALAPLLVPESRSPVREPTDPLGSALLTAALLALIVPLVEGRGHGWPEWCWISLAAVPVVAGFLLGQQRARVRGGRPTLVDSSLLETRTFGAGLGLQVAFWAGQASFFLVLALYLQQGRGLSALQSGGVFTILAVAYLVASARAPALTARFGRRLVFGGALTLAAGHLALLAAVTEVHTGGSVWVLCPGLLVVGSGMGLCLTPLTTIAMQSIAPDRAGAASGALSTAQQVGGALGVAITGASYFGALPHGSAHAFELSTGQLALLLVTVAGLSCLLPGGPEPATARDRATASV